MHIISLVIVKKDNSNEVFCNDVTHIFNGLL